MIFFCLNCHFFRTKNKSESHKKVCANKDLCDVIMHSENTKILKFQYQKSDKAPFVIYADLECIIEKTNGCENNLENSSKTKESKHIQSDFSMSTKSSFRSIENKHNVYRGKDCMEKFCESFREHAMKLNNFKMKKMKLLKKSNRNHMTMQKSVIFLKKNLKINI